MICESGVECQNGSVALESPEFLFQPPLYLCFFTSLNERSTAARASLHRINVIAAWGDRDELARVAPQAFAPDKGVLKTVAGHCFQLEIIKALVFSGLQKLARNL